MDKFQRSWELLKSSLAVMARDKQLLLFPIFTTAFSVILVMLFLVPVAFQPTGHSYTSPEHWQAVGNSIYAANDLQKTDSDAAQPASYRSQRSLNGLRPLAVGYFALMYFASMFLATFCNVAFYQQILVALGGGAVSVGAGFRFACTRWKAILMWTLFAGLVGYLIRAISERVGFIGQLVMKLLGTAWSIACVFVIPVIITNDEAANPFTVLKQSALTLKRTWGESLVGYVGVSLGGALGFLASLFWLGGGVALGVTLHLYWFIGLVVATWLIAFIIWGYLLSVASQIFRCALFVYATQGALPHPYTNEMMALAWKQKKS
jgi:hypothetical protein